MRREDIRTMVRALRDLDRMEGHQPFADIVGRAFANRPAPGRRCLTCRGPLDGWMATGSTRLVWCRLCTSWDEAMAYLRELEPPLSEREQAKRDLRAVIEMARSAKGDLEYALERIAEARARWAEVCA